jgi:hypothetical protein
LEAARNATGKVRSCGRTYKGNIMNHESSINGKVGVRNGAHREADVVSSSHGVAQRFGSKRGVGRNWAWAHSTESYDWMDVHGPFVAAELLD